jgi:3-isopropylmalate dehydratase small subunit
MAAVGIKAIVARSFSDIYRDNCLKNGLLPIVLEAKDAGEFERDVVAANGSRPVAVDLAARHLTGPSGVTYTFAIDAAEQTALLEGLDDIGMTLREDAAIAEFEARSRVAVPWNATVTAQP